MPVPKKKTPKGRRNRRRSHHALSSVQTAECATCGSDRMPHHACASCGTYKGRRVTDGTASKDAARTERKAARKKAEAEAAAEDHSDHDHAEEDGKEAKKEDK